jgi:hypothetical protein
LHGHAAAQNRSSAGRARGEAGANGGGGGGNEAEAAVAPVFVFGLPPTTATTTITAATFAPGSSSSGLLILGTSAGDALAVRVRGAGARFRRLGPACAPRDRGLALAHDGGGMRAQAVTCAAFLPSQRVALGYGDGRLRVFELGGGAVGVGGASGRCEGELVPPPAALAAGRGAPVSCLTTSTALNPSAALLASVTAQRAVLWRGGGCSSNNNKSANGRPVAPPLAQPQPLRPVRSFPADPYPAKWAAVTPDGRAVLVIGGEGAMPATATAATTKRRSPPGRERGAVLTAHAVEDGRVLARASLPLELPGEAAAWPSCFALSPDGAMLAVGYGGSSGEIGAGGGCDDSSSSGSSGSSGSFHVLMVDLATFQAARWLVLTPPKALGPTLTATTVVRQLAFLPGGRAIAALVAGPSCSAVAFSHAATGAVEGLVPLAPPAQSYSSSYLGHPAAPLLFALDDAAETLVVVGGAGAGAGAGAGGGGDNGGSSAAAVYDLPSLREAWWRRKEEARRRRKGCGVDEEGPALRGTAIVVAAAEATAATLPLLTLLPSDSSPLPPPRSIAADKSAFPAAQEEAPAMASRSGGCDEGGAAASSSSSSPSRRLLRALEGCEAGAFPQQHRARIWSRLLRLPENDAAFAALDALGDDDDDDDGGEQEEDARANDGALQRPPTSLALAGKRKRAEARVRRVAAALERWFPPLGQEYDGKVKTTTATLGARLARPLCSRAAFGRDGRAAFEAAATLLLHWCGGWLDWCPGPPLRLLRRVFALLRLQEAELADALLWRAPLSVAAAATSGAWDWLSSLGGGGEALGFSDWARVWDRVLCEGAESDGSPVELLHHFFVAWMRHHRAELLRLAAAAVEASGGASGGATAAAADASLRRLRAFFSERRPLGPGAVSQLLQEALRMRAATPSGMLVGADAALAPPGRLLVVGGDGDGGSNNNHSRPGALPPASIAPSITVVSEAYPPPRGWPLASVAAMRAARRRAAAVEASLEAGQREAARLAALERALEHDLMALAPHRSARLRGELGRQWGRVAVAGVGSGLGDGDDAAFSQQARRAAAQVAQSRAEEREESAAVERRRGGGLAVVAERRFAEDEQEGAEFAWRAGG